jgi:EAL domain-containing protein (putative c-di-GMP-specific phosphodiesterase class I)/DNA-binding SARP family transcriptional activator/FixJ family two-component response regulator
MIAPVAASGRTITLLGRVAVGPSDNAADARVLRGRRAELVFSYLAAEHQRVVTNDELANALWPDRLPDTWEAALRGVLTEVRRFLSEAGLDPAVLGTMHRGHRMLLPAGVSVDLDDARAALAAARTGLADGTAAAAAALAARASSLARLPFLPNHEGEWVDGIRRELESTHARALELEARAAAAAGDLAAATAAAERLVQVEPFTESAHQLRIRILGEAGDRSGAIKAFEHCRDVLAAELGIEPAEETVAAYRAAVDHDVSPIARSSSNAPPPSLPNDLGSLAVLVVEDHDFQRRTAMMLLRNLGVGTLLEAADGVAALSLLSGTSPPDVIVCDIDMPGMDGVEFIHHVAEDELAGAVIIASALEAKVIDAVRSISESHGLQVLGALEKPLTARRLGEMLATYRPRRWQRSAAPAADGAVSLTTFEVTTALSEGRIVTHLQPAVDVATGRVSAADSQPRWYEPGKGWVSPNLFLPVVEREKMLGELSERALETACAHLSDFAAQGLALSISVDIAPDSLQSTELAVKAADVVRSCGVDPGRLTFALDERLLRTARGPALGLLTRLRVKGFGVSLRNFGAGRTDGEQLRALPITEVRLAPYLVSGAGREPQRTRLLEDTVHVGRDLDLTVVGAGCEDEDDLRLLLEVGCDSVTGGFIAEAMPGEELPGWVASWDPERLVVGGDR